jgi:hypothetical protein
LGGLGVRIKAGEVVRELEFFEVRSGEEAEEANSRGEDVANKKADGCALSF